MYYIDVIENGRVVDHLRVTGNFGRLFSEYSGPEYWHGHTSLSVLKMVQDCLFKMARRGIKPYASEAVMPTNWSYGASHDWKEKLPDDDIKRCYLHILLEVQRCCLEFPEACWYSDNGCFGGPIKDFLEGEEPYVEPEEAAPRTKSEEPSQNEGP